MILFVLEIANCFAKPHPCDDIHGEIGCDGHQIQQWLTVSWRSYHVAISNNVYEDLDLLIDYAFKATSITPVVRRHRSGFRLLVRSWVNNRKQVVTIRIEAAGVIPVAASVIAPRGRDSAQDVGVVSEDFVGPDAHKRAMFSVEIAKDPVLTTAVGGTT